jgi:hypothetical protein
MTRETHNQPLERPGRSWRRDVAHDSAGRSAPSHAADSANTSLLTRGMRPTLLIHNGWLAAVCVAVGSTVATAQCATVPRSPVTCDAIQILSDELTLHQAEAYCGYAAQERKKVDAFWGATWTAPIRIHVSSAYRISRALVPGHLGNRGFMEMPLRRVHDNSGALLHEMVHIYAPNQNRFLAEGLAVYLHTKLGGNPALPNFGEDLRPAARRSLWGVSSLAALNDVRTPRPLGSVMDDMTAYILAGSFVQFLIEEHGLVQFRSLYDTSNYETVYGASLATLEKEWRAGLSS